jgi:hypothetical protein
LRARTAQIVLKTQAGMVLTTRERVSLEKWWEAMASRVIVPACWGRAIAIILCALCLPVTAFAHGGGGGHGSHFGGGHSGGGHFGGHAGHNAGHFGWLSHRFGHRSAPRTTGSGFPGGLDGRYPELGITANGTSMHAVPPTSLWLPALSLPKLPGEIHFHTLAFPHYRHSFSRHFSTFPSSGCFFNGVTQVCFFEPFLSLLCFSGGFDPFFGFGFGENSRSDSDELSSVEASPPGMAADLAQSTENPASDAQKAVEAAAEAAAAAAGKGAYVFVLKDGTVHAVADYWLAAGYLEYVLPDGARSHIPVETLDLGETVAVNSRRGLPFVLRSSGER